MRKKREIEIDMDRSFENGISPNKIYWEKVSIMDQIDAFASFVTVNLNEVCKENFEICYVVDDGFSVPKSITRNTRKPYCTLLVKKGTDLPFNEDGIIPLMDEDDVCFTDDYFNYNHGKMEPKSFSKKERARMSR